MSSGTKPVRSSRTHQAAPKASDISIDALIDDLFGLNIRAVKTLWASLSSPREYAEAAWSVDWSDRYTPSFRLWFTLMAILFFFQFFWAGEQSALIAFYSDQITASGTDLPAGLDARAAAANYARINFAILPLVSVGALFILSFLFRAWGQAVPYVVRARYVFAIIIPSTFISLPLYVLFGIAGDATFFSLLIATWSVPFVVNTVIAYAGVYASIEGKRRVLRSLFLALCILLASFASSVLSAVATSIWIRLSYPV